MQKPAKKWALFVLRWTIAVVGIWYVISNISWRDRAIILNAQNRPVQVRLARPAEENSPSVWYLDPADATTHQVFRSDLVNEADQKHVTLRGADRSQNKTAPLLALELSDDLKSVQRFLIEDAVTGRGLWVPP